MLKSTANNNIDSSNQSIDLASTSCVATPSSSSSSTTLPPTSLNLPATTAGNIISLVSLGSPQKQTKLFPWNTATTNTTTSANSPTKVTSSSSSLIDNLNNPVNTVSNTHQTTPSSSSSSNNNNKQILRPQVMLGNNNRINFAHLNRPLNDSIHVVLKKPSNQTIVIVSKPTPSSSASTSDQQIKQYDTNQTSNIRINNLLMSYSNNNNKNNTLLASSLMNQLNNKAISKDDPKMIQTTNNIIPLSYNDNELIKPTTTSSLTNTTTNTDMPIINKLFDANNNNIYKPNENLLNTNDFLNAKPIKLIPIKKLNAPVNIKDDYDLNDKLVLAHQTNGISLTLPYITSTNTTTTTTTPNNNNNNNNNTNIINFSNNSDDSIKNSIQLKSKSNNNNNNDENTTNNFIKSDVTRCICEMDHDDGFMICCDKCL
jgi:hypothetical protein